MSIDLRRVSNSRAAAFAIVCAIVADTGLAVWLHVAEHAPHGAKVAR